MSGGVCRTWYSSALLSTWRRIPPLLPPTNTRRPCTATGQRDRRGKHGRDRCSGQSRRAAVLRCRLAAAGGHVVAGRPNVADGVGRVRTAPGPLTGHPPGDGKRPRPVHVPGVQRSGPGGVVERNAPGARHGRSRRSAGQPVPGTASPAPGHR